MIVELARRVCVQHRPINASHGAGKEENQLCSPLPQKGRVKCSLHSNTEPKQPNSGHSSPTHRVRRRKRGNSSISSRPTRRLPKPTNRCQFTSIRRFNGERIARTVLPSPRKKSKF